MTIKARAYRLAAAAILFLAGLAFVALYALFCVEEWLRRRNVD